MHLKSYPEKSIANIKWATNIFHLDNYLLIIYWLVHDMTFYHTAVSTFSSSIFNWTFQYNMEKKANKISTLKSVNKFQSNQWKT